MRWPVPGSARPLPGVGEAPLFAAGSGGGGGAGDGAGTVLEVSEATSPFMNLLCDPVDSVLMERGWRAEFLGRCFRAAVLRFAFAASGGASPGLVLRAAAFV